MSLAPIYRIAQEAGVSIATVSRVASGKDPSMVSPKVRARVQRLIRKYDYVPNSAAKSLVTRRSLLVGVQVSGFNRPRLMANILASIEWQASEQGYGVLLGVSDTRRREEERSLEAMLHRRVDGLIWIPIGPPASRALVRRFATAGKPFVAVHVTGGLDLFAVTDQARGGYLAADYLLQRGHRHIAMVAGPGPFAQTFATGRRSLSRTIPPHSHPHTLLRSDGYRQAMEERGLLARIAVMDLPPFEAGYYATKELLRTHRKLTAIFADYDEIALGVYRALREKGIRIGADIAVIGFDDEPYDDKLDVPLTSVSVRWQEMGAAAFDLVLKRLKGEAVSSVTLEPRVVPRVSCGE